MYMVHNTVWWGAGLNLEKLCLPCLESRMGRALVPEDFTAAHVNQIEKGRLK
jgi:hypothetical protein